MKPRFPWTWVDWLAWACIAGLGAAIALRQDLWGGIVFALSYPVIRSLAAGQSKPPR